MTYMYTQAFGAAVKENFPDHLRLSIHQSTGECKISLSLLPTDTSYTTPWMCAVAYSADGTLTSAPKGDFEADPKYQIVYRDGRPSHFVERSASITALTEVTASALNKAKGVVASTWAGQAEGKNAAGPCTHCGKSTHAEAKCFIKYPHRMPKRLQERMASLAAATIATPMANTENAENEAIGMTA